LHTGGCAVNTAIALAKLGGEVGVLGITGNDVLGRFLREELLKYGIDVRGLKHRDLCSTSATMVLVHPDGERSFLHHMGANSVFSLEDVDLPILDTCGFLHIAGSLVMPRLDGLPTAEILRRARRKKIVTSLDTAWDASGRWLRTLEPCLPHLDYFMPSLEEARQLSGLDRPEAILEFFLERGVGVAVLKMGERGSMARNAEGSWALPAFPSTAVDGTGAGDCFAAGFLRGLIEGWELEQCLRLGNAAGALCVRSIGATSGISTLEEAISLMRSSGR
jgi:sugar/nucleoside kinase (ribokinase family)